MKKNNAMRFKIILKGSKPIIWRRVEVSKDFRFFDLAQAILDSMGWSKSHLYQFSFAKNGKFENYDIKTPDIMSEEFEDFKDMRDFKIMDKFVKENIKSCAFIYDFGDGWQHEIKFEGMFLRKAVTKYPVCLAGKNACPLEDSGGLWGYYEKLEILKNKKHPEYSEILKWLQFCGVDEDFDPTRFDHNKVIFEDSVGVEKEMYDQKYQKKKASGNEKYLKSIFEPREYIDIPKYDSEIGTIAGNVDSEHLRYFIAFKLDKKIWAKYTPMSLGFELQKKSDKITILENLEKIEDFILISVGIHMDVPAQNFITLCELVLREYNQTGSFLTNGQKPDHKELKKIFNEMENQ